MHRYTIKTIWKDIVASVKENKQDFTTIELGRGILMLAIPMMLEMVMESVFAIVDIFFVSRLGADQVAAVGITESMMTIVYAIAIGLSTATTAIVARRIGEKDPQAASKSAFHAIFTGVTVSLILAIPGLFFGKELLQLMGATTGIVESGSGYTTIMLGGNIVIMLLFIINAVFRSAGDAAISMRVLWMANIINIILDPCLIFGIGPFPEMGVEGAAAATCIGRGMAVIYPLYVLFKGSGRIRLMINRLKLEWDIIKRLFRLSAGGIGQLIIATSSWVGMVRIISEFGSDALAGYTIAIRIVIFTFLPSWGLSNSAETLMGQNLGANKPERAERAVWITAVANSILMGSMGLFFIISPEFFIKIFIDQPNVIAEGAICLRFIGYGYFSYAFGMVVVKGINGSGDTMTPTKINFFCFWLLEIPLAWLLAMPINLGPTGVYIAILTAETMLALAAVIIFRKGKWKTKQV